MISSALSTEPFQMHRLIRHAALPLYLFRDTDGIKRFAIDVNDPVTTKAPEMVVLPYICIKALRYTGALNNVRKPYPVECQECSAHCVKGYIREEIP